VVRASWWLAFQRDGSRGGGGPEHPDSGFGRMSANSPAQQPGDKTHPGVSGDLLQIGFCVVAEVKRHARFVPAIQVLGLAEVRVASQQDSAKARPTTQRNRAGVPRLPLPFNWS